VYNKLQLPRTIHRNQQPVNICRQELKSNLFLLEPFIPLPLAECFPNRRIPSRIPIVGKGGCRWLGLRRLRVGLWGGLGGVFRGFRRCVGGGGGSVRVLRISFWLATFVLRVKMKIFSYPHILLSPPFPSPLVLITACKLSYGVLSPLNRSST
jgi:hypothetical protein